jgi:hypothetical protein
VQIAHSVIRPPNYPATVYPTCATIPGPLHQSPTLAIILIAARHAAPAHYETSKHDSPNKTKIKVKQRNVPGSNSNIAKSMTHHT